MGYELENNIIDTYKQYIETEAEEDIAPMYEAFCELIKLYVRKYVPTDNLMSVEDVTHMAAADITMKVVSEGLRVVIWGLYLRKFVKGYAPYKLLAQDKELDLSIEIDEALRKEGVDPEFDTDHVVNQLIAQFISDSKKSLPYRHNWQKNLIMYMSISGMLNNINLKQFQDKRLGFNTSLLRHEFINLAKGEQFATS